MIVARDIHKSYGGLSVLKGISLSISEGEVISIVGASGAGKSTLLHILGTLDKPDSGFLEISGTRVDTLNDRKLSQFRNRKVGFVFQFHHLLPEFTALENICIPGFIGKNSRGSVIERAYELMDVLGIRAREKHKPSELSGGEQQRVAIARALINNPDLVLADEPSGNLDSNNARELHSLFFELRNRFRKTFVIVTHNTELAGMADRKLTIRDGLLIQ
jgi:lipoprotein-releasing system ATP-binding protein